MTDNVIGVIRKEYPDWAADKTLNRIQIIVNYPSRLNNVIFIPFHPDFDYEDRLELDLDDISDALDNELSIWFREGHNE